MKKILLSSIILVTLVTSAFSSTGSKTNNKAMANLEAHYAGAKDVFWTVRDNFEKASFTLGSEKMEVYYDAYGDLIGSTKTMAFDKLPKSALDILTTDYTFPAYQLTDCIEYTDADNNSTFYISFDSNNRKIVLSVSTLGAVQQM